MDIAELISKYGFPIVAACGLGYFVYYIWVWATQEVKPILSEAQTTLIALIDRIRMLDNDLIRLNQKLNTVLQLRGKEILEESKKEIAEESLRQDQIKEEKKKFRYKKKED
jgi:hypothetical protein